MRKVAILVAIILIAILSISACSQANSAASNPASGMQVATIAGTLERMQPGEPTSTPGVAPKPKGIILLQDDFSNPDSGWSIYSDDYGTVGYENNTYTVKAIKAKEYNWGVAGVDLSDVRIDADVSVLETNTKKNDGFGVDCRIQENGDGYGFRITSDGYIGIFLFQDTKSVTLIDWLESNAIYTDGSSNHLTAVCKGNQFTFLVNGINVGQVQDDTFTHGDIALSAVSFEDEPVKVAFDNLVVKQP
jgi:uncharacterized protein YceK